MWLRVSFFINMEETINQLLEDLGEARLKIEHVKETISRMSVGEMSENMLMFSLGEISGDFKDVEHLIYSSFCAAEYLESKIQKDG